MMLKITPTSQTWLSRQRRCSTASFTPDTSSPIGGSSRCLRSIMLVISVTAPESIVKISWCYPSVSCLLSCFKKSKNFTHFSVFLKVYLTFPARLWSSFIALNAWMSILPNRHGTTTQMEPISVRVSPTCSSWSTQSTGRRSPRINLSPASTVSRFTH